MTKEYIINEIDRLIETKTVLEKLDSNIQNIFFGISIFDTNYLEGYYYYEELVYNLMINSFGDDYIFDSDETFEIFVETIYDIATSESNTFKSGKDVYDFFLNYKGFEEETV